MFKVPRLMDGVHEGDKNQEPIKAMGTRLAVSSWIGRAGKTLGNTTRNCIRSTIKRRDCSGGLKGNCLSVLPLGQVGCGIHRLHPIPPLLQLAPLVSTRANKKEEMNKKKGMERMFATILSAAECLISLSNPSSTTPILISSGKSTRRLYCLCARACP